MAKPRVFVSSTYYDLKHIRKSIELFISEMGYESVLFENGDIAFNHQVPLDDSCYKELESCQIFVLVLGGRYGSEASEDAQTLTEEEINHHYKHYNSITKREYDAARKRDIPIYIFIEKGVSSEYQTYKENKNNETIKYAHVDSVNIFRLVESIFSERRNNLVKEFEHADDIISWLKEQWAGLFSEFLNKKSNESSIDSLEKQLEKLNIVTETLKDYSEKIIQGISPNDFENIINVIDSNERTRKDMGEFSRISLINHLIIDHETDEHKLFDIYKSALSYQDFSSKVGELMSTEGDGCGILSDMNMDSLSDLTELRHTLKLSPWEKISMPAWKKKLVRRKVHSLSDQPENTE